MNVQEALKELIEAGVTNSEQMLRRWIRQGKIEGELKSKKEGYTINRTSLQAFIKNKVTSNKKNGDSNALLQRIKKLEEENKDLRTMLDVTQKRVKRTIKKDEIEGQRLVEAVDAVRNLNQTLTISFEKGYLSFDLAVELGKNLTKEEQRVIEGITSYSYVKDDVKTFIAFIKNGGTRKTIKYLIDFKMDCDIMKTLLFGSHEIEKDYIDRMLEYAADENGLRKTVDDFRRLLEGVKKRVFSQEVNLHPTLTQQANYRQILGLPDTATDEEVKRAFKKLLAQLHPDKGGNAYLFDMIKQVFDDFRRE